MWWDGLIDGGEAFAHTIEARLESVDVVLAAWSASSVASDWVRDEAAHGRDRQRFVAVTLDGVLPPLGFRQYHAIDVSGWKGQNDAPEFAAVLRAVESATQGQRPSAPGGLAKHKGWSRRAALVSGGAAVAIGGTLAVWQPWRSALPGNSIAVLPFRNLGGDPQQSYFSDGLAEEIRARLASDAHLAVAAPTSSNLFRAGAEDAREIARKLGVAWLLEGTVRRAAERVRVTASLIDGHGGMTSWSQTFERALADIFAVEGEVAGVVAGALAGRMGEKTHQPLPQEIGGTDNIAAYDLYLQAKALYDLDKDAGSYHEAAALVERALAADPAYARAYVLQSRILMVTRNSYTPSIPEMARLYDRSLQAVRKALAITPDLPAAHAVLAYTLLADRFDFAAALPEYRKARALASGDADIAVSFANFMYKAGRDAEASRAIAFAEARDPLNPIVYRIHGIIDLYGRRLDAALGRFAHALALNPNLALVHSYIGDVHLAAGRADQARAEYAKESNESFRLAGLAIAAHRLGEEAASRQAYADLLRTQGDSALYQQAQALAQRGDIDAALAALERGYALKDSGLLLVAGDAKLDPLRQRPEFIRLLARMGLAPFNRGE